MHETINIGDEYDDAVFRTLTEVLKQEDARQVDREWGVGGSQEVTTWRYEIKGEVIDLSSETYRGLTIDGEAQLVKRIAATVRLLLAKDATLPNPER